MNEQEGELTLIARAIRFLLNCIRLRSSPLALWVVQYENHNPKFD